jgi:ribosomal protein L37AE/L43A
MAEERAVPFRKKILAAMGEIGSISKAGRNEKQGYAFQRASDILAATQAAFLKHKLVFLSEEAGVQWPEPHETQGGNQMFVCIASMKYTIMDAESGEQLSATHSGCGFDTSDKALNKAKTQSLKYFLKGTFLIGEDDDEDDADKHHIEARAGQKPACPSCGTVGSIRKGREEYGGGWFCSRKAGGCGAQFAEMPAAGPQTPAKAPRRVKTVPDSTPAPKTPQDGSKAESDEEIIEQAMTELVTGEEIAALMKLLETKGRTLDAALKWVGAESLESLSRAQYDRLRNVLMKSK